MPSIFGWPGIYTVAQASLDIIITLLLTNAAIICLCHQSDYSFLKDLVEFEKFWSKSIKINQNTTITNWHFPPQILVERPHTFSFQN